MDRKEFGRILTPISSQLTKDEMDKMFKIFDENQDGLLDKKELAEADFVPKIK